MPAGLLQPLTDGADIRSTRMRSRMTRVMSNDRRPGLVHVSLACCSY